MMNKICTFYPDQLSLMHICSGQLVLNNELLKKILHHLPVSIHTKLFTEAALMMPRCGNNMNEGMITLISTWPKEVFSIQELLPTKYIRIALNAGSHSILLPVIVEGLLRLHNSSQLKTMDFTGVYNSALFELPVLSVNKKLLNFESVKKKIHKRCGNHLCRNELEDLESVISWKIDELCNRRPIIPLKVKDPINILTELKLNLSDYVSMDTEILGLAMNKTSCFKMNILRITVENYHYNQASRFKGLLNLIDTKVLQKIVVNGKRRGINLLMWDLADELEKMKNLKCFGLTTSGLKMHLPNANEPTVNDIFCRASLSFSKWTKLSHVSFTGTVLKKQIATLLGALVSPLYSIVLNGCDLDQEDILHLSNSHHTVFLEELDLQHNNLCGIGKIMCELLERCQNLCLLNLAETKMSFTEKVNVLNILQGTKKLEILVMYENEDMLKVPEYNEVIELACLISGLVEFYVFPMAYKPLDAICRSTVEDILIRNHRTDLELFY